MSNGNPLFPGLNHSIPLSKAREMTSRFRTENENLLLPPFKGKDVLPRCETFNREVFDKILAASGCVGIRIYLAMNAESKVKLVIVGVNSNGEDILPSEVSASDSTLENSEIGEEGQRCPPICPPSSPLNS